MKAILTDIEKPLKDRGFFPLDGSQDMLRLSSIV